MWVYKGVYLDNHKQNELIQGHQTIERQNTLKNELIKTALQ